MKLLLMCLFSFAAFTQDVAAPSKIMVFMDKYWPYLGAAYAAFEFLVGKSKLKANSTIDMIYSFFANMFK